MWARYGVACNRKNSLPLPMGMVTVFCPPTTAGGGLVIGVQTAGGIKSVVVSRL
jgi:hypothetical protein